MFFDFASAQLTTRDMLVLARFKRLAIACGVRRIVIDANVDAAEFRRAPGLDRRRAETVRNFLSESALPFGFSISLWGDRAPLDSSANSAAEAVNRYVMIRARG